jgi:hypothetical protein
VCAIAGTFKNQRLPDIKLGEIYSAMTYLTPVLGWARRINLPKSLPYGHTSWNGIVQWLIMLKIENPSSGPEVNLWIRPIPRKYLDNRFIFQTHQGYIGIGPPWMELSDQVVIFDGGATPFILRKVSTKDGDSSDMWQLVGDCYLVGWMDGNFFGHTVVDQLPSGDTCDGSAAKGDREKYLVRESFVLC